MDSNPLLALMGESAIGRVAYQVPGRTLPPVSAGMARATSRPTASCS
ncbi:MAG: hypothetical protein QM586_13235 [Xenophilus sp.]